MIARKTFRIIKGILDILTRKLSLSALSLSVYHLHNLMEFYIERMKFFLGPITIGDRLEGRLVDDGGIKKDRDGKSIPNDLELSLYLLTKI